MLKTEFNPGLSDSKSHNLLLHHVVYNLKSAINPRGNTSETLQYPLLMIPYLLFC